MISSPPMQSLDLNGIPFNSLAGLSKQLTCGLTSAHSMQYNIIKNLSPTKLLANIYFYLGGHLKQRYAESEQPMHLLYLSRAYIRNVLPSAPLFHTRRSAFC